jgi:cyanophycin synthetase
VRERAAATRLEARIGKGYAAMWSQAARDAGAEVVDLGGGFLELRKGPARTRVWGHWVAVDDIVTRRLALEKAVAHRMLRAAGLPVPEQAPFAARDLAPALAFLRGASGACFVKPAGGSGGAGATGCVVSPRQLRRAARRAARRSRSLLIERQVAGDVYRLLFLDGELLDVIRRDPPRVTGDGASTVAALIAAENRRRFAAAGARGASPWLLTIDLDCIFTLERAGSSLASVPPPGERVAVKTAVNSNGPEDNESVHGAVGEALIAQAALAAQVIGVRLAGVDVVPPDPAAALDRAGGVILEVNATPGLGYHYAVRNPGRTDPVATQILRRLLAEPMAASGDRHITTHRRENGDGRQAKVGGDVPWPGFPDPDQLGATRPGDRDRSGDLRGPGDLGPDEPALHDGVRHPSGDRSAPADPGARPDGQGVPR